MIERGHQHPGADRDREREQRTEVQAGALAG